jgi:hypothetical protein
MNGELERPHRPYNDPRSDWEVPIMLPSAIDWTSKREDLRSKRRVLVRDFEDHPSDVGLALKIKAIDDEIVVCTEHVEKKHRPG